MRKRSDDNFVSIRACATVILFILTFTACASSSVITVQSCTKLASELNTLNLPQPLQMQYANQSCHFTGNFNGAAFEYGNNNFGSLVKTIQITLQRYGWRSSKNTLRFAADAPFSTQFAMEKRGTITVANVSLQGNTANCPKNQPLDLYKNCGLTPQERNYQIEITTAKVQDL